MGGFLTLVGLHSMPWYVLQGERKWSQSPHHVLFNVLATAEPEHLHYDTNYSISLVDSNKEKNLYRKNILSSEYACCLFYPCH